ncbi:hypothetical protein BHE74_00053613 [Ensete ventricosum]|nr:hypothetical protein BHE74_00053613 [Ensete ventricosum]
MVSEPSKGSKERGWPPTARPSTRVAGHGLAPNRGGHPRPGRLQGAASSMRGRPWAWLAPTGAMPASLGNAHGQAAGGNFPLRCHKGQPRGQGCRMQRRPLL